VDPDPAYHFDADPEFYLMRIQVTKMMRIHADQDPQQCGESNCSSHAIHFTMGRLVEETFRNVFTMRLLGRVDLLTGRYETSQI
jgi:hypothetical protein